MYERFLEGRWCKGQSISASASLTNAPNDYPQLAWLCTSQTVYSLPWFRQPRCCHPNLCKPEQGIQFPFQLRQARGTCVRVPYTRGPFANVAPHTSNSVNSSFENSTGSRAFRSPAAIASLACEAREYLVINRCSQYTYFGNNGLSGFELDQPSRKSRSSGSILRLGYNLHSIAKSDDSVLKE